jgi:hypothetical protein
VSFIGFLYWFLPSDRRAILEILVATKPGLPPGFAAALGH